MSRTQVRVPDRERLLAPVRRLCPTCGTSMRIRYGRTSPLLPAPSPVIEQRFVPVVVATPSVESKGPARKRRPRSAGKAGPTIELEIDGVSVRIPKGTDPRTITAVIQALKGSS